MVVFIREAVFEKTGKYFININAFGEEKRTDVSDDVSKKMVFKQRMHSWPVAPAQLPGVMAADVRFAATQLLFSRGAQEVAVATLKLDDMPTKPERGGKPVPHTLVLMSFDRRHPAPVGTLKLTVELEDKAAKERARLEKEAAEQAAAEKEAAERAAAEAAARAAAEKEAAEKAAREAAAAAAAEKAAAEEAARVAAAAEAARVAAEKAAAEEKARREAELKAMRAAEEEARREAEEAARLAAEARARVQEEERRRWEEEERRRREAEEKARREAEEKAKQERLEAEEGARRERARRELKERLRREAEERARAEVEEQARREARERAAREEEERRRREEEERARREEDQRARREAEKAARRAAAEREWGKRSSAWEARERALREMEEARVAEQTRVRQWAAEDLEKSSRAEAARMISEREAIDATTAAWAQRRYVPMVDAAEQRTPALRSALRRDERPSNGNMGGSTNAITDGNANAITDGGNTDGSAIITDGSEQRDATTGERADGTTSGAAGVGAAAVPPSSKADLAALRTAASVVGERDGAHELRGAANVEAVVDAGVGQATYKGHFEVVRAGGQSLAAVGATRAAKEPALQPRGLGPTWFEVPNESIAHLTI